MTSRVQRSMGSPACGGEPHISIAVGQCRPGLPANGRDLTCAGHQRVLGSCKEARWRRSSTTRRVSASGSLTLLGLPESEEALESKHRSAAGGRRPGETRVQERSRQGGRPSDFCIETSRVLGFFSGGWPACFEALLITLLAIELLEGIRLNDDKKDKDRSAH